MTHCPPEADLSAYATGRLIGDAWDSIAQHLSSCSTCVSKLESMTPGDPLLNVLRIAKPVAIDPAYERVESVLLGAKAIEPGATLGEYELLEPLGRGGMGSVFKARHIRLDKIVALKVMRHGGSEALARFEREMKAIGRLNHEHVVAATDAGNVEGVAYLVMECVEGQDLAKRVKERGPLPAAEAFECIRQAALGLSHAHHAGLVHRDVKPSNLIRTPDGTVKVLDLGLAVWGVQDAPSATDGSTVEAGEDLTGADRAVGTRGYMAPEQLSRPHQVDARADVYGLGSTLWYLLTGKPPQIADGFPGHRLPGDLPVDVWRKFLAEEPEQRFASVTEAAAALPSATKSIPQRPPWGLAAAAIAVTLLIVGAAVAFWRNTEPPATAVPEQHVAPVESESPATIIQREQAAARGVPVTVENKLGMRFVLIPTAEGMVNPPASGDTITKPFRICETEVTVGQFRRFIEASKRVTDAEPGGAGFGGVYAKDFSAMFGPDPKYNWRTPGYNEAPDAELPVTQVSWRDAMAFCEWLTTLEGIRCRLPTRDEWQWACAAGARSKYHFGDDPAGLGDHAWYGGNSDGTPHPCAKRKPNAWGLFDMHGNVREWTLTETHHFTGKQQVICGGSYTMKESVMQTTTSTGGYASKFASSSIGFRVLREEP